jgi:hypothetical protein
MRYLKLSVVMLEIPLIVKGERLHCGPVRHARSHLRSASPIIRYDLMFSTYESTTNDMVGGGRP